MNYQLPAPGVGGDGVSLQGSSKGEIWVQVIADDGTWGLGACGVGKPAAAFVEHAFAPLLEGRDCLAIEFLNDLMVRYSHRHGLAGTVTMAQSGVDLALWDLKGKLLGQPVYSLLGGPCREEIPLYATGDDLDWEQELGFTAFKITNPSHYSEGIVGIDRIEEHVAKAREALGSHVELMINPVMSYNVEYTLRVAERLRPYELRWLEEPLIPTDIEGHVRLRQAITWIPLATGENHYGRHAFQQLVERRAVDIVQPDIRWCGGLSELMKIYTIAEAAGIPTIPHAGANSPFGQHFAMAAPESPMAEFWLGTDPGIPLAEVRPLPGMAMPKDGVVRPSDAPGFGLGVGEESIEPVRT